MRVFPGRNNFFTEKLPQFRALRKKSPTLEFKYDKKRALLCFGIRSGLTSISRWAAAKTVVDETVRKVAFLLDFLPLFSQRLLPIKFWKCKIKNIYWENSLKKAKFVVWNLPFHFRSTDPLLFSFRPRHIDLRMWRPQTDARLENTFFSKLIRGYKFTRKQKIFPPWPYNNKNNNGNDS